MQVPRRATTKLDSTIKHRAQVRGLVFYLPRTHKVHELRALFGGE
jgi:hypothetical protein